MIYFLQENNIKGKEERECLKYCETNQGFSGSYSNITMIKSQIFLLIKSKSKLSLTYEEQKRINQKQKVFLLADLIVKKRSDYIDFQALIRKPNPSIKAVEWMKTT